MHCCVVDRGINKDLNIETVKNIIDEMEANRVYNLNITGGEPFLYQNGRIMEVLRYAERKKMRIHLNTNFTVLDKAIIKELAKLRVSHIDISIHGFSEKILKRFCRTNKNNFEKLKKNIRLGIEYELPFIFTTTITKINYQDILIFLKYIGKQKIKTFFSAGLFHPTGQGLINYNKLFIKDKNLNRIYSKILDIAEVNKIECLIQKRNNASEIKESAKEIEKSIITHNFGCPCGEYSCFIWPDGRVTHCPYGFDDIFVMGNVYKNSLKEIWNSKTGLEWKHKRKKLIKTDCKYYDICFGGCPCDTYHLTGDIYSCDPYCAFLNK
tara:strand:- start:2772 stop:3743 length:972 start_codon:yes stop_codon:yes gene_type:complete